MEIRIGTRKYNPDTAQKICETPHGTLYRKSGRSQEFYLYNPKGETNAKKITSVPWADANNLVKTYGTRDQWIEMFTTFGSKTGVDTSESKRVYIDDYHYIKAVRNADIHHMSVKDYIMSLIDKDDANNNYAHKSGKFE